MAFDRISVDRAVMGGVPCVRGTRMPVATVVGMLAEGLEPAEVLADFPQLTRADLQECLGFAAAAVSGRAPGLPASA